MQDAFAYALFVECSKRLRNSHVCVFSHAWISSTAADCGVLQKVVLQCVYPHVCVYSNTWKYNNSRLRCITAVVVRSLSHIIHSATKIHQAFRLRLLLQTNISYVQQVEQVSSPPSINSSPSSSITISSALPVCVCVLCLRCVLRVFVCFYALHKCVCKCVLHLETPRSRLPGKKSR